MRKDILHVSVVLEGFESDVTPRDLVFTWQLDSGLVFAVEKSTCDIPAELLEIAAKKADLHLHHVTSEWYHSNSQDLTNYGGVSYGSLVQQEFHAHYYHTVRSVILLKEILAHWGIGDKTKVVLQLSLPRKHEHTTESLLVPVLDSYELEVDKNRVSRWELWRTVFRKYLIEFTQSPLAVLARFAKRAQMDSVIKLLFGRFMGRKGDMGECSVVFFFDVNNRPTVQQMCIVADSLSKAIGSNLVRGLTTDDRVLPSPSQCPLQFVNLGRLLTLGDFLGGLLQARRIWQGIEHRTASLLDGLAKGPIDLATPFGREFISGLKRRIFGSAINRQLLNRTLTEWNPSLLVVGCDAHPDARLAVQLAGNSDIRTVTLQHGATCSPHGYVPVYADTFFAWGEVSRRWLVDHGAPEGKICVTGNPRFGGSPPIWRSESAFSEAYSQSDRVVLVATQPVGLAGLSEFLGIVGDGIAGTGFRVRIRLHPSQRLTSEIREITSRWSSEISVEFDENPDPMSSLKTVQAVIAMHSTLGLEALYAGRLLITVETSAIPACIPYKQYGACHQVGSGKQLSEVLVNSQFSEIKEAAWQLLYDYLTLDGADPAEKMTNIMRDLLSNR